jgi:uncharacterized protein
MSATENLPQKPRPRLAGPEKPFWDGLREGEIRVQKCSRCGRSRFPANRYCPRCHSPKYEWKATEPKGEIETFCVFHKCYFAGFAGEMPYAVIQVRLKDPDLRFYSNPVGIRTEDLKTGLKVRAVFEKLDDAVTLLKFEPAEAAR